MGRTAGFGAGIHGPLENIRAGGADDVSVAGAGDDLCAAAGGRTGASETIIRAGQGDRLEPASRPDATPFMNLKLSRRYRRWIRTRDRRQLWWSIPALAAVGGWLVLIFCL